MAVRQIAGKVLKKVFSNHDKNSAKKLLTKLSTCSVVGKE
jgi:IS1 family transposase